MATIVPEALPDLQLGTAVEHSNTGLVDAATARQLIIRVNAGWLFVPASAEEALLELEQEDLDQMFATHLNASPLTTDDPMDHRVFALAKVLTELADRFDKNLDPRTGAPNPLRREALAEALRSSAEYRQKLVEDLQGIGLSPEASLEVAQLIPITANRVESVTGLTSATLGVWRQRGQGPRFMTASAGSAKAGPRGRVLYPLGELLTWLYGQDKA